MLAEGEKESQILKATAEKQTTILKAEAEAESILKVKTAEAEGIRLIREAEAEGLKSLKNAEVTPEVLTLKSYETFQHVAEGNATKIIIPSEMQNLASTLAAAKEIVDK